VGPPEEADPLGEDELAVGAALPLSTGPRNARKAPPATAAVSMAAVMTRPRIRPPLVVVGPAYVAGAPLPA
jgi:hypothetical protein